MESSDSHRLAASLGHLAARGADAAQIADAIVATWSAVEVALVPIIGMGGLAALYQRSLHQTRTGHPWLAQLSTGTGGAMDLAALQFVLGQQHSAAAAAGGGAHLQALYELLTSLIGLSLTERLLRPAWTQSFNGPDAQDLSS